MKFSDRTFPLRHRIHAFQFALLVGLVVTLIPAPTWSAYVQTNLVSDIPGEAPITDPNLVNPWGISHSSGSPFWVSDNGMGVSTLYNGSGQPFPVVNPLVVTIPSPTGGTSAPTGQVFNGSTSFGGAPFIFATEDGTIAAWNGGTNAVLAATTVDAVYKGLAIGNNGSGDFLYATNFRAGTIDVFNSSFTKTTLPGNFIDPNLPAGYAPFNIETINGMLYVTYAKQDADKKDDVAGPGNGFVDVFDLNGNLQGRLISNGPLDSPWGLALAPSNFGDFSNDLLVGNFGDGLINAFDPTSGQLLGTLLDAQGNPIVNQGLWGLIFGNGGNGGDLNKLYFTAGIPGDGNVEDHGLFGVISVPEPDVWTLIATALLALFLVQWARRNSGGAAATIA
jgi:uncharacterized protein (TIGR03118 family)